MLNLHGPKKWFFGEKFISESIRCFHSAELKACDELRLTL